MRKRQRTALGQQLRKSRRELDISQQELGARVGVKQPTVANWEAGRSKPAPAVWSKVAKALGLKASEMGA